MDPEMNRGSLSAYETYKVADMASRKSNGGTVTAIVLGGVAVAGFVGAWIFSNAKSNGVRDLVAANQRNTESTIDRLANLLTIERNERVAQGTTISQTITDSISGQQQGSQSQSQTTAIDNTVQQVMQQTFLDAVTGRSSLNPTPVNIYSAPQPCGCPGCGN